MLNGGYVEAWRGQRAVTDNGTLYIELFTTNTLACEEMLAVSPEGKLLWGKAVIAGDFPIDLYAKNGRLYVQYSSNFIVYDAAGREVWHADNIRHMPAIDENGTAYMATGFTGGEVKACDSDGYYLWHKDTLDYGLGDLAIGGFDQKPMYSNHTIYVPLQRGLIALNQDGSLRWKKEYDYVDTRVWAGPDEQGNIYLQKDSRIVSVNSEGIESTFADNYNASWPGTGRADLSSGILYDYQTIYASGDPTPAYQSHDYIEDIMGYDSAWDIMGLGNRTLDELQTVRFDAYNIKTGKELWNYTLPLDVREATLTESNYRGLVIYYDGIDKDNMMPKAELYRTLNVTYGKKSVAYDSFTISMPVNGMLYVDFWTCGYEVPAIFGESKCAYAGGIYAISKNGSLVWFKPTGSRVTSMNEHNGTIYYGTNDGKMSAARVDATAGFALTAAFYLLIRFFLAGAVTRARGIVDKNETRNNVLKYIASNPGSSLYDISKDLRVNMGTARYHLMILSINHRIVSCRADGKYVRYFTNAGSYSLEQQFTVSIMRRESVKKALNVLLEKSGLSNIELSREIGVHESATSRLMKELVEKGVVAREAGGGRLSYSIRNEYREPVAFAMERLGSP